MPATRSAGDSEPRHGYVPVGGARIFFREIGHGPPCLVLHGGPDFDHRYLLPELDRLADTVRLVYYDQRGRGASAQGIEPESVTIDSELRDLDEIRASFGFDRVALLGHSWGGLLAAEYASRHPERTSHLVLMNSAPVSHADWQLMSEDRRIRASSDLEQRAAVATTSRYRSGDLEADAEYYRIHFRAAVSRPELVESIVSRLRLGFTPNGIVTARAIEKRLYLQTWNSPRYNLLPRLARLEATALLIHGDQDLIPRVCAENIARAIPGSRLVVLEDCGHFAYLERPEAVHKAIVESLAT